MGFGALFIVFPAVAAAIIAGFLLSKLIGMYMMGEIGPYGCVIIVGVYMGMLISAFTWHLVPAALLLVLLIGLLLLPSIHGRHTERKLYNDQMRQFIAAIESDPQNMAARGRLAETLYKMGDLDGAIAQMSEVVSRSPSSIQESHRLQQFVRERDERKAPPVKCPNCGHSSPPGRTHCYNCESSLSLSREIVKWLQGGGAKQIIVTWAITVAVVTLIVAGLSMFSMTTRILIAGIVLIVVLIAFLVHMHMNS